MKTLQKEKIINFEQYLLLGIMTANIICTTKNNIIAEIPSKKHPNMYVNQYSLIRKKSFIIDNLVKYMLSILH